MGDTKLYRKLQKHLNKQAVGFPKSKSGVDITLLQYIFSEAHAKMALNLSYKWQTGDEIHESMQNDKKIKSVPSRDELREILESMADARCLGVREKKHEWKDETKHERKDERKDEIKHEILKKEEKNEKSEGQTSNLGENEYALLPFVVGLYELQAENLTDEFLKLSSEYFNDPMFGLEFLSTKFSQMRTIPIEKSITPGLNVQSYNNVLDLI